MEENNSEEMGKVLERAVKPCKLHQSSIIASIIILMHNTCMRTSITLNDDTHSFALYYAHARGLTLGAAVDELIRKAQTAPEPKPEILVSSDGFPMFPPSGNGRVVTDEIVKKLEEEAFDSKKFA